MKNLKKRDATSRMPSCGTDTAADLMTANPVSISGNAPVREAIVFLTDRGFSAAPVVDDAGRPIGVVSRSDIVVHDRETVNYLPAIPAYYEESELQTREGESLRTGFQVEQVDPTQVRDIMTPTIFAVTPETPADAVIEQMVALNVHRLFVVGDDGVLIGVISALDLLRRLATHRSFHRERATAPVSGAS